MPSAKLKVRYFPQAGISNGGAENAQYEPNRNGGAQLSQDQFVAILDSAPRWLNPPAVCGSGRIRKSTRLVRAPPEGTFPGKDETFPLVNLSILQIPPGGVPQGALPSDAKGPYLLVSAGGGSPSMKRSLFFDSASRD